MKKLRALAVMGLAGVLSVSMAATAFAAEDFDANFYYSKYADVAAAVGNNAELLKQHWTVFGKAEGRQGSANGAAATTAGAFDAAYYLSLYPDVAAACGGNLALAEQHWNVFGKAEGRVGSRAASAAANKTEDVYARFKTSSSSTPSKRSDNSEPTKSKENYRQIDRALGYGQIELRSSSYKDAFIYDKDGKFVITDGLGKVLNNVTAKLDSVYTNVLTVRFTNPEDVNKLPSNKVYVYAESARNGKTVEVKMDMSGEPVPPTPGPDDPVDPEGDVTIKVTTSDGTGKSFAGNDGWARVQITVDNDSDYDINDFDVDLSKDSDKDLVISGSVSTGFVVRYLGVKSSGTVTGTIGVLYNGEVIESYPITVNCGKDEVVRLDAVVINEPFTSLPMGSTSEDIDPEIIGSAVSGLSLTNRFYAKDDKSKTAVTELGYSAGKVSASMKVPKGTYVLELSATANGKTKSATMEFEVTAEKFVNKAIFTSGTMPTLTAYMKAEAAEDKLKRQLTVDLAYNTPYGEKTGLALTDTKFRFGGSPAGLAPMASVKATGKEQVQFNFTSYDGYSYDIGSIVGEATIKPADILRAAIGSVSVNAPTTWLATGQAPDNEKIKAAATDTAGGTVGIATIAGGTVTTRFGSETDATTAKAALIPELQKSASWDLKDSDITKGLTAYYGKATLELKDTVLESIGLKRGPGVDALTVVVTIPES